MSIDLDNRGREAARHLTALIGDANLELADPGRRRYDATAYHGLAAAAGAVVAVVAVLWLFDPLPSVAPADDRVTVTTETPTTNSAGLSTTDAAAPPKTETTPTTETTNYATSGSAPTTQPADVTPPFLQVHHPTDGQIFETKELTFEGSTEVGARVFAGPYEADVFENGTWRIVLLLSEGANRVTFVARDEAGNVGEASVTAIYQPSTTTTTAKPELTAFDANFTSGECNIDPPFDEYYGVGQPGSEITVESEYGFGSTVVNESGEWYLKVEFPIAPPGQTFAVKVFDQFGRKEVFEFTSTVGG